MKRSLSVLITILLFSTVFISCSSIPRAESEKKYANSESKFIEVDGMRIHYRIEGKGPVIVLLHGMLSSLQTWDGWTEKLSQNYTVIRLDLPGFGLTRPSADAYIYTADGTIKILSDFFNELKLTKFTLVGNSLGGYFSWKYAVSHPEKIEKLILIDAVAYPQDVPLPITLLTMPFVGENITPKFVVDYFANQVYGNTSRLTKENKDRYYELLMVDGNRSSSKQILGEMKIQSKNTHVGDDLASLNNKMPILVIWGGLDPWIPLTLLERWKKDLPSAKYVVFEKEGHMPMEEMPGITVETAIEFMNNINIPSKSIISKSGL